MKFPHCERLSLEKKMDFATDKCLSIWEDCGFDQFLGVGGHSAAAGETIGTEWGRRIYHNKLEIGIIEPVGKMGFSFCGSGSKKSFSSSEEERDRFFKGRKMWPLFKGQMCGHKIEVKLFSFFFNFFFLKLKLHITTTMIYDFGTQTFLRCSSVAGSANCWSIGLLSDSSLYVIKKIAKKKNLKKKN